MSDQAQAAEVTESAPVETPVETPADDFEQYGTIDSEDAEEVAESAPAEEPGEEVAEPPPAEEDEQEAESSPAPDKFQARINKVTKDKYDAIREAAELREKLKQYETAQQAPREPTLEDCDYDEEKYIEAKADYKAAIKLAEVQKQQAQQAAVAAEQQRTAAFIARAEAYKADKPDYDATVATLKPILAEVQPAIGFGLLEDENGPAMLEHFAKHPSELDALNAKTPTQIGLALGRLSAKLEAAAKPVEKPKTKAPPPVKTVGGGGAVVDDMKRYEVAGAVFE